MGFALWLEFGGVEHKHMTTQDLQQLDWFS
jgi:hypothetical protein